MTANDDNDSGSDNSDSHTTPDAPNDLTRHDALPLLGYTNAAGGWTTAEDLVIEFGLTHRRIHQQLELLEDAGDIELSDLGQITLVTTRTMAVEKAVAELFDKHERAHHPNPRLRTHDESGRR